MEGLDDIMGALNSLDPTAAVGSIASALKGQGDLSLGSLGGNPSEGDVSNTNVPQDSQPMDVSATQPEPVEKPEEGANEAGSGDGPTEKKPKVTLKSVDFPHMRRTGITPLVQNVVSMFNLGTKLDLKHIALHARNAEYNPKRFAAVIMRIREPKTTALIFGSGKVVVTGAADESASKRAAKKFAKIIKKLGFPARFKEYRIQNIVGSCGVNFPVRLEQMAYDNAAFSAYEPELFPGLIFRMLEPKIVLLIFVSGKIVFTGGKSRNDVYQAFENIYPVMVKYDKNKGAKKAKQLEQGKEEKEEKEKQAKE